MVGNVVWGCAWAGRTRADSVEETRVACRSKFVQVVKEEVVRDQRQSAEREWGVKQLCLYVCRRGRALRC